MIQYTSNLLLLPKMDFRLSIAIIAVATLLYLFKNKLFPVTTTKEEKRFPFKRKPFLLNIPEREFFEGLQQILPTNYVVFPQILLSKIVKVHSAGKKFRTYHNKINQKTIDFVIFEKQYLKPILAIEYDGKSHNTKKGQTRDNFVNNVLETAGIKILHIKHQKHINFEEIKDKIAELLPQLENTLES